MLSKTTYNCSLCEKHVKNSSFFFLVEILIRVCQRICHFSNRWNEKKSTNETQQGKKKLMRVHWNLCAIIKCFRRFYKKIATAMSQTEKERIAKNKTCNQNNESTEKWWTIKMNRRLIHLFAAFFIRLIY